jgi:hypothetical protein
MKKFDKATQFAMTALDREILTYGGDDIDLWSKGYFDCGLFDYQSYFYHAPQKNKMLVASIRVGKSFLAGKGGLHKMQFNPGARFLNTSISSEQAKIVYTHCLEMCNAPKFSHWVEHVQSSPYPLIRLVNGSELWFRSIGYEAELIRGFEFDVINCDEAAYITREHAIKTLQGRLLGINPLTHMPRLNEIWFISSPKGGQGWLYERWKKGDPKFPNANPAKFLSLRATIWDNPLLDQSAIQDIIEDYTEAMIQQELYGEFILNSDSFFPYEDVMACCQDDEKEVRWLYEQIAFWNERQTDRRTVRADAGLTDDIVHYECDPQPGHQYISSWDFGKKTKRNGRNAMVGLILDVTHEPWTQVAYFYQEGMKYIDVKFKIEEWSEKYGSERLGCRCRTAMDSTGKGDVVEEIIERENSVEDYDGYVYSAANKPNILHAGKLAIERGITRFPFIRRQVDQLTNYVVDDKDIAQDIVMAYCQAVYAARDMLRLNPKSDTLQRKLNAMPQYHGRNWQARMNPRYVQSRMGRRVGGQGTIASRQRITRR